MSDSGGNSECFKGGSSDYIQNHTVNLGRAKGFFFL